MNFDRLNLARLLGRILFPLLLALVAFGALIRQPWPGDFGFLFVRWPFWLLVGVAVPLIGLRILTWRRRRASRQQPPHAA